MDIENGIGTDRSVKTAIQKITGTFKADTVRLFDATVKSVDEDAQTCVLVGSVDNNDIEIPDVKLTASVCDGLVIVPVIDSDVKVICSVYNDPIIIQFSDIEKWYLQVDKSSATFTSDGEIKFNDGSFDGLVKVKELTDKINALENLLNGFINIYNTHTHTASSFGAPTTVPSAIESQSINPITQQSDIENDKITHGQ
jgi:Tfp pilus assembly protein PilX